MTNLKVLEVDLTNLRNQLRELNQQEPVGTKASLALTRVVGHVDAALDALQKHNKHASEATLSPSEPTTSALSS